MLEFLSIIQIVGVMIGFWTVFSIMRQQQTDYKIVLAMAEICCITAMLGYLFTLQAQQFREMMLANKFGYFGKCFATTFSVLFITKYYREKVPKIIFPLLFAFDIAVFWVIMASDRHPYYYSTVDIEYNGYFYVAVTGKTPLYYTYMAVTMLLLIWFEAVVIRHWKEEKKNKHTWLSVCLLGAGLIPFFMLGLFLTGVTNGYDTTPLGILLSCTMITLAVQKFGLFDTVRIAKETVVENIKESVFVVDTDYQLLYENNVAKELLREEGTRLEKIKHIFEFKDRILDMDGKSYEVRVAEIKEKEIVRGYMAWIFDVTVLQKNTKEILQLKEEAEHATKAKSDFLANMSHEIRTPMNAIIGMTEMILRGNLEEEQRDYAYQIKNAGNSLLTIINDILDFSKIESGKMELVETEYELMSLVDDVGSIIRTRIGDKDLTYHTKVNPQIPHRLYGDDNRIKQMIINLANNAVKFTREGTVLLTLDYEKAPEGIHLIVKVKDTGIGIKKEDMQKIFESFGQVDSHRNRSIEGSGLGLAITKNLASLMNGKMEVRSMYNIGSEFSFIIPQKVIDETPCSKVDYKEIREKEQKSQIKFKARQAKVLVVDDNRVNLMVAEGLMRPFEMQLVLVDSAKKALQALKDPTFDIVFMDHMMPDMDGVEATKAIREMEGEYYRKLPIVAFSANAVHGAKEMLLKEGMNDFVAKPIEAEALIRVLLEWLPKEKVVIEP